MRDQDRGHAVSLSPLPLGALSKAWVSAEASLPLASTARRDRGSLEISCAVMAGLRLSLWTRFSHDSTLASADRAVQATPASC